MGVAREDVERGLEVLVQQGVVAQVGVEVLQLVGGGQLTVDQQVGHLVEGGVFCEVGDVVAAVAQDSFVAVDVGDLGLGGAGGNVAGVEGDQAGLAEKLAQHDTVVAFGGAHDVHLVLAAWVLEHYLVVFRSHGSSFLYVKSHY